MNSTDKENTTAIFIKQTKQNLIKSFEYFVESNIESRLNSLLNQLVENKIEKYESFLETIMNHPIIASKINEYKNNKGTNPLIPSVIFVR